MTDFAAAEFQARMAKAQAGMSQAGLDAMLLCTEAEVRYFSGFRTLFWQSPTRPWFLILPATGEPIAVIPGIGAQLMARTWVNDIRTWSSPDPIDDGVSLLADALSKYKKVGLPMSEEASLRMPLLDFYRVSKLSGVEFSDCSALIKAIRTIKSEAEIEILKSICSIGSAAFAQAADLFSIDMPLNEAFRQFKIALLSAGCEEVPYLVGGAGNGGYDDVISPPNAAPLKAGDVLMLDTGSTLQGYFCDFDRNFAMGHAGEQANRAYQVLWEATEVGLEHARAGVTCSELFNAMHKTIAGNSISNHSVINHSATKDSMQETSGVGRYGHGLGIQLTEYPSIAANDHTVLQPGMVMTLEPSMSISEGKMMVHEENIVITDGAPILLTSRAASSLPVIA